MKNLQRVGGIAAIFEGLAYIVGIVGFVLVLDMISAETAAEELAILVDNELAIQILYIISYQLFAIALVVLTLALYHRLKDSSPVLMQIATAIGVIWATVVIASGMIFNVGMESIVDLASTAPAQAETAWVSVRAIADGIGGANEILGGLWILLISGAAMMSGRLSKGLNYIGVVIGVAGIVSAFPVIGAVGLAIFGPVQIIWFLWLGIVMVRGDEQVAEVKLTRAAA